MRIGVTGTPGTGKTTATRKVSLARPVVHLNELIESHGFTTGWDDKRETAVADIDALRTWLAEQPPAVLIESHLAHLLPVEHVIVLRCNPSSLEQRLRGRLGESTAEQRSKVEENVDSERLDLIFVEALDRHGQDRVTSIDTTDRSPDEVADDIERIVAAVDGNRDPTTDGTRDA